MFTMFTGRPAFSLGLLVLVLPMVVSLKKLHDTVTSALTSEAPP